MLHKIIVFKRGYFAWGVIQSMIDFVKNSNKTQVGIIWSMNLSADHKPFLKLSVMLLKTSSTHKQQQQTKNQVYLINTRPLHAFPIYPCFYRRFLQSSFDTDPMKNFSLPKISLNSGLWWWRWHFVDAGASRLPSSGCGNPALRGQREVLPE